MIIGTSYFRSRAAAVRYFARQGEDAAAVDRKLAEGLIHIGKPPTERGDIVSLIKGEGRYQIERAEPPIDIAVLDPQGRVIATHHRVPRAWTMAEIRRRYGIGEHLEVRLLRNLMEEEV